MPRLTRNERAAMIRIVEELRERCELALELLLPDEDTTARECEHDVIEDLSTMGEDLYRCSACGAEGQSPIALSIPTPPTEE